MKRILFACFTLTIPFLETQAQEDFNNITPSNEHLITDRLGIHDSIRDYGVLLDIVYTAEFFHNTTGGMKTGNEYKGDLSIYLEWDSELANLWNGGTFFVHLQEQHGYGITENYVGDFQVVSNIDADDFTQVSEFWYKQSLWDENAWIKIGKQEANDDFAYVDYGLEFIHSSPGFSPTIPMPSFPDQDWGVVLGTQPLDALSMNVGVYHGRPNGGRSIGNTIDHFRGPLVIAEPAYHYAIANHPGHFRMGGWWNGDRFEYFDSSTSRRDTVSDSYGWYVTWDQEVWSENSEDKQGIGVFAQYGWAPEDRSEVEHYYGGGFQWVGALPSRDEDIWGVGAFTVEFSNKADFADERETAIELFYMAQLTNWMNLKPDLQYIMNPGGIGNDDALALGLRCEIIF